MTQKAGIFFAAVIVALGGLIYELLISTASSYLYGNSVTQFSITIGLMLFAMGIGSLLSTRLTVQAEKRFVTTEVLLAVIGGNSVPLLYYSYAYSEYSFTVYLFLVLSIGILIGLEIPLMLAIGKQKKNFLSLTSKILSLDYFGALIASIAFPIILLPYLGIIKTSLLVGLLNIGIAFLVLVSFRKVIKPFISYASVVLCAACILFSELLLAESLSSTVTEKLYQDDVIYSKQTNYQHIVITKYKDDVRLYLDGNIQLSSIDEYRYHESLVHLAMSIPPNPQRIAVLGGGDGMAIREILKYQNVEQVDLVELDPDVIEVAKSNRTLSELNSNSLSNPKVTIHNQDAFTFIENNMELYNVIIIDLPDPNNETINKLYTKEFYTLVKRNLTADGVFVTQATSSYFSPDAFQIINNTIASVDIYSYPYHAYIPSFGDWGFVLGSKAKVDIDNLEIDNSIQIQFLNEELARQLFSFPEDYYSSETSINTLFEPTLYQVYDKNYLEWYE